jgi:regulator of cell morphogenesis and NO signaling
MADAIRVDMRVREVVVDHPAARRVLERFGIDYCCGGEKPLGAAAAEVGADMDELLTAMRQAEQSPQGAPAEPDWRAMSMTEMANHIERQHHTFMRRELPRLEDLLARVRQAHQEAHGQMLGELTRVFSALRAELEMHLLKEEQVLFPYLRQIEHYAEHGGQRPEIHCITVLNPITQMRHEHENAGAALEEMHALTGDFALPPDACQSFRALYEGLQEMEADLHQHIHLENNILFPRAIELETAVLTV